MEHTEPKRVTPNGVTLVEVVVAMSLVLITLGTAYFLYGNAQRTYRRSDVALELQQGLRTARTELQASVSWAGFRTHPDGDPNRRDEPIEGAWEHALVVRADFDAFQPSASEPETSLAAGGAFATVTTGNDEIVAFFVGGPSASERLEFWADAGSPRDGIPDRLGIERVARVGQAGDTLYRMTWSESGAGMRQPLLDGVTQVQFQYFDRWGTEIVPPGGVEAADPRFWRAAIRRIDVTVEARRRSGGSLTTLQRIFSITPRNLLARAPADPWGAEFLGNGRPGEGDPTAGGVGSGNLPDDRPQAEDDGVEHVQR